jgi:hypothetical protein
VPQIGIVPFFNSRGTPHHAARETSISELRILPAARNELQLLGSFTCPKVGTWDRLFDFPSEEFYIRKIRRLRPGLNPRIRELEASMLNTRPPKPLTNTHHRSAIRRQTPVTHTITTSAPFYVILIKHRIVLPDDGSYMIRNMLE